MVVAARVTTRTTIGRATITIVVEGVIRVVAITSTSRAVVITEVDSTKTAEVEGAAIRVAVDQEKIWVSTDSTKTTKITIAIMEGVSINKILVQMPTRAPTK